MDTIDIKNVVIKKLQQNILLFWGGWGGGEMGDLS